MKLKILTLSFFLSLLCRAQYHVTFIVQHLPAYDRGEAIYLAGNFNDWVPNRQDYQLKQLGNKPGITIELKKGMYQYKFTKGSWDQVETDEKGFPKENRLLNLSSDTTINVEVTNWADHFPKQPKKSTASSNVHIIDTAFYMPQLKRHRRVWIYLPADYNTSGKKYPVFYMQDGQNLFDDATAPYGEWGIDEALDTLGPKLGQAIIVGIDNGQDKRMNEYAPHDMEKYGKGEGDLYLDFLAKTLKPFVDKHYRTHKDAAHTFIAGSSMGGLISFYALLKYPNVFGGAGIFSPAFWINPSLMQVDPKAAKKIKGKVYFYAGGQESESMVPDMLSAYEQIRAHSKAKMETVIRSENKHNESAWREEFPEFYRWMMDGAVK
jgi:predicted alpha/beta superfamily hydrolase